MCLAATACGTVQIRQAGEAPSESSSPGTIVGGPVPLGSSQADAAVPAEVGGHQYGSTLDQYQAATDADVVLTPRPDGFQEIRWEELIPTGFSSDEVFAQYEDELLAVEPGSQDAELIYAEMQALYDSAGVNKTLNGEPVLLAGFVAPLTYEGDLVTEFLLVPTFGACIHVPAPPPNQTILISLPEGEGLTLEESWGAIWVAGTMTATGDEAQTAIGSAGYSITGAQTGVYSQQ